MEQDQNNNKNRNWLRTAVLILALCLMAAGGWQMYTSYRDKQQQQDQYMRLSEDVHKETTATQEASAPYVSPIDFDTLMQQNPDVVGWITVPGTSIDYPIVQTDNNDTYLTMGFDGKKSVSGAVYVDYESQGDFLGMHTLLYGNNMKNGSMFADVNKFKKEDYFKEHREVIIYTPQREFHLKTIAALYTDASPIKRKTIFSTDEALNQYVQEMTKGCPYREIPEEGVKRLYSLVTCSYEFNNARTILYAYDPMQDQE